MATHELKRLGKSAKTLVWSIDRTNLVLICSVDQIKKMYSDQYMKQFSASPKMFNLHTSDAINNLLGNGNGSFLISLKYNRVPKRSTRFLSHWIMRLKFSKSIPENYVYNKNQELKFTDRFNGSIGEFWNDLYHMHMWASNWGDVSFDAFSHNFAINDNGKLIALDVLHKYTHISRLNQNRFMYSFNALGFWQNELNEALEFNCVDLSQIQDELMQLEYEPNRSKLKGEM